MKAKTKWVLWRLLPTLIFFIIATQHANAQCDTCDHTTTFYVDLSSSPNATWISPDTQREGECCINPGMRCLRFIVITHPDADLISFNIATPPIPPGQEYQYECGPHVSVGEPLCITGVGPHCIVYCKPGADLSQYSITVSEIVQASPDIGVADGCTGMIWATGLDEPSIVWNSIYPGIYGQYNSYLDCTVGCDTANVQVLAGYPPYIDFEVSGAMEGPCSGFMTTDTVRVYFYDDRFVNILPDNPVVCFGATNATITAYPTGGHPPYEYLWSTGETTQSIMVGVGTYTVSVTDQTVCPPVTDVVIVTQHLAPITANAGPDQIVCINDPDVSLTGAVGTATGGIWSGGTGIFVPSITSLNAVYTPTAAEIAAGTLTLYLTTTGNGGCPAVTDMMTVTFLPEPIVTAGPDLTVCANNSVVSISGNILNATAGIWTSSGTGSFSPTATSWNALYTPSSLDTANGTVILTFTATNGCAPIFDNLVLNILPAPYVNAGPDLLVCETDIGTSISGVISGATSTGLWTTSGSGFFSPAATNLNTNYNFGAGDVTAGSVTLTLTSTNNGSCNPVSDQLVISLLDVPVANAGPNITICNFDPVYLNGTITGGSGTGIWTSPDGTGVFNPNHTFLNATYYPSAYDYSLGSFTLILTSTNNGTCVPAYDNLVVTILPEPVVFAGPNQIVCSNNGTVTLSGVVTNGATQGIWTSSGTGTFVPNATTLNANYVPSSADTAAGFIILTLSSTDGCTVVTDQMNITYTPAPYVNANGPYYICYGETSAALDGVVSAGASTGLWTSMGTGSFSPGPGTLNATYYLSNADTAAGSVTITLTSTNNGSCLPVLDVTQIIMTSEPIVDAGPDQTICGNQTASLNGVVIQGAETGIWTSSGTGYFVPDATDLNAVYVPSMADTAAGSVILTLTATDACIPEADQLTLTITGAPFVDAGPDQVVCQSDPDVYLDGVVSSWALPGVWTSSGTGVFFPNANDLNAVYMPSPGDLFLGTVVLTLTSVNNGACDPSQATMTVNIVPPPVANAGPNQIVCANNSAVLAGIISGGSGQGMWTTPGNGTFSPDAYALNATYTPGSVDIAAGSVNLTLVSINNGSCDPSADQVLLTIQPAPVVNAGPDQIACENNPSVDLSGSVTIATGGIWTTSGTGSFSPSNIVLNATYNPSAADVLAGSVQLTLTSTGNGLCLPVTDIMTVSFYDGPNVNAGADLFICEGVTSVTLTGSVSGPTINGTWSTLGSGMFFPSPSSLTCTYFLGSADLVNEYVYLLLTSTNNGDCYPVTDTILVTITDIPAVNAGPDQTVCANDPNTLLNGVVFGDPGTGEWSTPNGTGVFTPSNTSLTTTYMPTANDALNGFVTIIFTSTNTCIPVRDTMRITITPAPLVDAGDDQIICSVVTGVQLHGSVSLGATTGIWSTVNGTGTFSPSASNLNAIYNVTAADLLNGNVILVLTSTNNGDCFPVSDTTLINFGVNPVADFDFSDTVCLYQNILFTNTSTVSEGYILFNEWDFGLTHAYTQNAVNAFTSPGIYDVQLVVFSNIGCTDTIVQQVTLHPLPIADFSYSPDCSGDLVIFADESIGAVDWFWLFGNGFSDVNQAPAPQLYELPGSYDVSLYVTDVYNCTDWQVNSISILPTPDAEAMIDGLCAMTPTYFQDISTVADDTIISWYWEFGDGGTSILQNPTHIYAGPGNYDVILTVTTDDCSNSDTFKIVVDPIPLFDVIPSATAGCNLMTVTFTNNTTGASSYWWNFGDGVTSIIPSPSHTFINTSPNDMVYNVTLIGYSPAGCSDTLIIPITVHPDPMAAITSNAMPDCSPLVVDFFNMSTGAASYSWNFHDGTPNSTLAAPSHSFVNDTSFIMYFNVVLTAFSPFGCVDSTNVYVTVFPNPEYDFTITPDSACNPSMIALATVPGEYSYEWFYGDGTSQMAGAYAWHPYTSTSLFDTTYTVELVTTTFFGCTDTTEHDLVIHPSPVADFTVDTMNGCTPLIVAFENTSFGATTYTWNFGDGTTSTTASPNFTHTFFNPGLSPVSYNVQLVAESPNGCTSVTSKTINVYPASHSGFYISDTIGCSPLEVDFTNASMGTDAYYWDFGDGSTSTNTNPSHTFVNNGFMNIIYTTQLISSSIYGCLDTATYNITVHPKPDANYGILNSAGCSPYDATITNASSGATTYLWDFGDGSTSSVPGTTFTHHYENLTGLLQTYEIQLTVSNSFGCMDMVMQTVDIFPEIMADFAVNTDGCTPFTATFVNQSMGSVSYFWYFGDGNTSTNNGPTHTYINPSLNDTTYHAYLVTLSTYGCPDTAYQDVTVFARPQAVFTINSSSGCSPFNVHIENSSLAVGTYNWQFDDGTSSATSDAEFDHVFVNATLNPVTYDIILTTSNSGGCIDTAWHQITVYPEVTPIIIAETTGCHPLEVEFNNYSTGAVTYDWDFGDGGTSNDEDPVHTFFNLDPVNVETNTTMLVATSEYGCYDSVAIGITIYPTPQGVFSINEITGCSPFSAIISNSSQGADHYYWDFGDGTSDTTSNAIINHTYGNYSGLTATYFLDLYVTNDFGCEDFEDQAVTIYPDVEAGFICYTEGCSPLTVNFTNMSQGAESYYWHFGDGASSGESDPFHTFTNFTLNDAIYNVGLVATSEYGCQDTFINQITVWATPVADFTATPTYQVYPSTTVSIANHTSGEWDYQWTFGDETGSTVSEPVTHTYATWNEYEITLIATGDHCADTLSYTIIIDAPPPYPAFEPDASGCAPFTVDFENNTLYATNYEWNFGDGGTSYLETPSHTFHNPGIYIVTLKVIGYHGEEALAESRTITVYEQPLAYFKPIPTVVAIPDEYVTFFNLSENGEHYYWDFGDGANDTAFQPTHAYAAEGLYDVYLYVISPDGCVDSMLLNEAILAQTDCQVIYPNAFAPGGAMRSENTVFKPIYKGVIEYRLEIFNRWGELIFVSYEPDEGWDGMYRDELSKQDVYVWKATYVCGNGERFVKTGDVTLLR